MDVDSTSRGFEEFGETEEGRKMECLRGAETESEAMAAARRSSRMNYAEIKRPNILEDIYNLHLNIYEPSVLGFDFQFNPAVRRLCLPQN